MAKVKIQGHASGTGILTVTAPNTSTDRTITLPDATGTLLNSDGDGSSLTGMSSGLYTSVAIIADQKAYDAGGGTFTSGAWRTRDLNTEISDVDGIVSISSNQFTLAAGTYTILWSCPARNVNRTAHQLYNATDSSVVQYGASVYPSSTDGNYAMSIGSSIVTIAGTKAFEIRHWCQTTAADTGFGLDQNLDSGGVSIFTTVEILKHS